MCPEGSQSPAPWPPHTPQRAGGARGRLSPSHRPSLSAGEAGLSLPSANQRSFPRRPPRPYPIRILRPRGRAAVGLCALPPSPTPGGRGPTRPGSAEAAGLGLRGEERGAALRAEGGREAAATPPPPAGSPAAGRSPEPPRGPGGGRSRVWGGDLGRGEGAAARSPRSKMAPAGYPGAGLWRGRPPAAPSAPVRCPTRDFLASSSRFMSSEPVLEL